jgi:hypothetical protein
MMSQRGICRFFCSWGCQFVECSECWIVFMWQVFHQIHIPWSKSRFIDKSVGLW